MPTRRVIRQSGDLFDTRGPRRLSGRNIRENWLEQHQLRYELESIRKRGRTVVPQKLAAFLDEGIVASYASWKERRCNDFRRELYVEASDIPLSDPLFSSSCRSSYVYARRWIVSVFTRAKPCLRNS